MYGTMGEVLREEIARLRGANLDSLLRKRAAKYAAMAQYAEK
jgi:hypothetical protein